MIPPSGWSAIAKMRPIEAARDAAGAERRIHTAVRVVAHDRVVEAIVRGPARTPELTRVASDDDLAIRLDRDRARDFLGDAASACCASPIPFVPNVVSRLPFVL